MADASYKPFRVAGQGMCCALGFDTAAATAAIRARFNHFQETQFIAADGLPLVGAPLHEVDLWGAERLVFMLRTALLDCLACAAKAGLQALSRDTALWVLAPEALRVSYPNEAVAETVAQIVQEWDLHPRSGCAPVGKGGVATAALRLSQIMDGKAAAPAPPRHVLLAATDSLLDSATVEQHIAGNRLVHTGHTDALVPGEGAAALLLTRDPAPGSVWIDGAAQTQEEWRLDAGLPLRAQGLTAAMRQAARQANCAVADLHFHASGATGEEWCLREATLALSRAMERRRDEFPHHAISHYLGETGAAAPLLTLAWLSEAMPRAGGSLGRLGLAHFAGDDGQRSALVLRHMA